MKKFARILTITAFFLSVLGFHHVNGMGGRYFVAIDLKPATDFAGVQRYITNQLKGIKRDDSSLEGLRYNSHGQYHVTLAFLGGQRYDNLGLIKDALEEAVKEFNEYAGGKQLCLSIPRQNALTFLGRDKNTLAYKLNDNEMLNKLVGYIKTALDKKGFRYDRRPFLAHVSVGVFKDGRRTWSEKMRNAVIDNDVWKKVAPPRKYKDPQCVEVNNIVLFQSLRSYQYENIAEFSLVPAEKDGMDFEEFMKSRGEKKAKKEGEGEEEFPVPVI